MKKLAIIITIFLSVGFLMTSNVKALDYTKNLSWLTTGTAGSISLGSYSFYFSKTDGTFYFNNTNTSINADYVHFNFRYNGSGYVLTQNKGVMYIPMSDFWARYISNNKSAISNARMSNAYNNSTITITDVHYIADLKNGIPGVAIEYSLGSYAFSELKRASIKMFYFEVGTPLVNADISDTYLYCEAMQIDGDYIPSSPKLHISDTHNSTTHDATIIVDTSEFSGGNYKYKWGYDQMAMAMHEVVSGSNGYSITVPYNDTIYFAVLNQDDTLVYETTYTIDYDDMPNQYTLHFHSYTDWGVNDIVKFVNDNTDYTDLDNFWEAGERYIFFYGYQRRVALGFYTDSNLTNEITFGTFCVEHDMNIYVKWSKKLPTYQARVYADEDKIKLNIQITEWLEESDNYRIFISQDIAEKNWTMTRGNYTDSYINTTTVDYDENVTLKFGYIENGTPKIIFTEEIDISVWITLNATEEEQEAINLINEAYNITNHIDGMKVLKDFIEMLKVPISFITRLISYIFSKMNFHTRLFVIGMFVANILVAVAKLIFRR